MIDVPMVEYHGNPGSTASCVAAVERLLHHHLMFSAALVLTLDSASSKSHGLLLTDNVGDRIVIKAGFTSGYSGEGPRGLSRVLALLDWYSVEIEELEANLPLMRRLDRGTLTEVDLDRVDAGRRIRPRRIWNYVEKQHVIGPEENPWREDHPHLPLPIIDGRLALLARDFWDDPDMALPWAHRRLETIIRGRIALPLIDDAGQGAGKLYGQAFNGDHAPLHWPGIGAGERQGRVSLFIGTVSAYRNARVHREADGRSHDQLAEFLLVNQLFRLEAESQLRDKFGKRSTAEQTSST